MLGSEAIHPNKMTVEEGKTYFHLTQITAMKVEGSKVFFTCHSSEVLVHFLSESLFRLKLNTRGRVDEQSTDAIFKKEWTNVDIQVEENIDRYILRTTEVEVRVDKAHFRVSVLNKNGDMINQDDSMKAIGWNDKQEVYCYKQMKKDEKFYGFGEKSGYLNKRGTKQIMWNTDVYAPHNEETIALYQSIPFFTSLSSIGVYGVFFDNPAQTEFDMTNEDHYFFKTNAGELDYYFFYAQDLKEMVGQYTELTGRMTLPPKWALGYQQSRYSYMNEEDVRNVAKTMRDKEIPCDVLHLDIHYMDEYRVFTWHPARFPNGNLFIQELKEKGFHVVPIVDPGVKKDPRYKVYQEGIANDYFCKYIEGDIYTGPVWPGESVFPDFTEENVREWWGDLHEHYTDAGISGIWNDMNEPAIFNETKTMDLDVMHRNEGDPKTHKELHNLYGYYMSKATYLGMKKKLDGERPFVVTRAGYAGIQRYAAIWTGDNRSFWDHLAMSIPMFLNMGLSGLPFVGSDVGGFAHPTNGPLLARWTQFGAFTPFFRNHSALDVPRQEPWLYGEEIEAICKKYIELRYRLMPHLYNLFQQSSKTGLPVLRPLVMEYPNDSNTFNNADQVLVGESILLAPVYRPDTETRLVYLPEGQWVNYWTEEKVEGGRYITVPTPLDTMPIFIKAGAVIAEGPLEQYAGQKKEADLLFHIYPSGDQPTEYHFYEDDGITFDFEKGTFNQMRIRSESSAEGIELSYSYSHKKYTSGRANLQFIFHHVERPSDVVSRESISWEYDEQCRMLLVTVPVEQESFMIKIKGK